VTDSSLVLRVSATIKAYEAELQKLPGVTAREAAAAGKALQRELNAGGRNAALEDARKALGIVEDKMAGAMREVQQFERVGRVAGGTVGELSGMLADLGDIVEGGITPITAMGLGVGVTTVAVGGLAYAAASAAQTAAAMVRSVHEAGTASGQAAEDIEAAAKALDVMDAEAGRAIATLTSKFAPAVERGATVVIGMTATLDESAAQVAEMSDAMSYLSLATMAVLNPIGTLTGLVNGLAAVEAAEAMGDLTQRSEEYGAAIIEYAERRNRLAADMQTHLRNEQRALDENERASAEARRERLAAAAEARREQQAAAAERERDAQESIRLGEQATAARERAVEQTAQIEQTARRSALSEEAQLRQAYDDKIDQLGELLEITQDFAAFADASGALQLDLERQITQLHADALAERQAADAEYYAQQDELRQRRLEAEAQAAAIIVDTERSTALSAIGTIQAIAQAAQDGANKRTEAGRRAAMFAWTISRVGAAAEIGANIAIGVSQALELPPPAIPVGVAQALLVGATATAQLAAVPPPKFHQGGEVQAVLESGEVVVPRARVQDAGGASAVDRALRNGGNQGPIYVQFNLDGEMIERVADAVDRRRARPHYGRGG
jgi:hypothetical protein